MELRMSGSRIWVKSKLLTRYPSVDSIDWNRRLNYYFPVYIIFKNVLYNGRDRTVPTDHHSIIQPNCILLHSKLCSTMYSSEPLIPKICIILSPSSTLQILNDADNSPTVVSGLINILPPFPMTSGDNEYTSLDFLSKIRLQPKRNIFKHLSLDTDLEEINQVLSPKAAPPPPPPTLDRQITRRFVLQLITKYEGESEANSKWDGFLKSMGNAQSFDIFVRSLKDIKEDRKPDQSANPESEANKDSPGEGRRGGRSTSCQKQALREKQGRKLDGGVLKGKIREEVRQLKDLLLAGERFLRQARNDY